MSSTAGSTVAGVVIKEKNGLYTVSSGGTEIQCHAGSRIRKSGIRLLAGDRVEAEINDGGDGFIVSVRERSNVLARPPVANIDTFVIVAAAAAPEPYTYGIDKLAVMAEAAGVEAAVVINKCDIADSGYLSGIYGRAGYRCFQLSAAEGEGTDALRSYLKGKTAVFAGASGVGKSSLLNAMYPGISAETGELSRRILRGRNTTRHTEFFSVGDSTYIADSPGFTMLDEDKLGVESKEALADCFPEFAPYFGKCRFRSCSHLKEEGCAVIEAVKNGDIAESRHESYVRLYNALALISRY